MSITQIKRDLSGIRRALKSGRPFENIIIYDPVKGIPELNSDETLIFLPEDGRDCN